MTVLWALANHPGALIAVVPLLFLIMVAAELRARSQTFPTSIGWWFLVLVSGVGAIGCAIAGIVILGALKI